MSSQVVAVAGRQPSGDLQRSGFRCFCGKWFPSRLPFDEHLKSHPGRFVVCDCCKRVLPKGSWKIDENGNLVSTAEQSEGARLGLPGSKSE